MGLTLLQEGTVLFLQPPVLHKPAHTFWAPKGIQDSSLCEGPAR